MRTSKVAPIVLRHRGDRTEVLVFMQPEAGTELVQGTVEAGESVSAAAVRELEEESGITGAGRLCDLGIWEQGPDNRGSMPRSPSCTAPRPPDGPSP